MLTRDGDGRTRLARPNFQARMGTGKHVCFSVQLTTSWIDNHTYPVDPYSAGSADHIYEYILVGVGKKSRIRTVPWR